MGGIAGVFNGCFGFIKLRPLLISHLILVVIGLICIAASGGRPELLAAGILIWIAVIAYLLRHFNYVKFPKFIYVLYFLHAAALLASLAAIIIVGTAVNYPVATFWGIWLAFALVLIIGSAIGIKLSSSSSSSHGTIYSHGTGTAADIKQASVTEAVLDEGQASVIYSHPEGDSNVWKDFISYRIVYGPGKYTLKNNEWCHFFNWTHPWSRPTKYPQLAHVLSTLEDHIYAKMDGLRTTDNKAVYLDVFIFFRLVNIDKLVKTHLDPIFAFRGVAREDIFRFVAKKNLEEFIRTRRHLCELEAFPALLKYAGDIGFKITKVTCIDYKDKPQTWKLSHHSDTDKAAGKKRCQNN